MKQGLLDYIAACEENIVRYKEMGDDRAVKMAEKMIADFQECIKEIELTEEMFGNA